MKGIVFTEFLELVEDKFGMAMVDRIIDECDLKSRGVYTSVGTYSHKEMFAMIEKLSELENIPVEQLLQLFGEYFFNTLSTGYPHFMEQPNMFTFLKTIDNYIHPEVLKLYPEAELPSFKAEMKGDHEMALKYQSTRKMADFAIGLIRGAAGFYNEKSIVEKGVESDEGQTVVINIKTEA
ncbi:MAG: heme NO-binding domain-containing protein [Salibacteraceae bacterium]